MKIQANSKKMIEEIGGEEVEATNSLTVWALKQINDGNTDIMITGARIRITGADVDKPKTCEIIIPQCDGSTHMEGIDVRYENVYDVAFDETRIGKNIYDELITVREAFDANIFA